MQTHDHIVRAASAAAKYVAHRSATGTMGPDPYKTLMQDMDTAGLLVSPEHDAAVAARAWDEGHTAGVRNVSAEFDGPVQDNPYKREVAAPLAEP